MQEIQTFLTLNSGADPEVMQQTCPLPVRRCCGAVSPWQLHEARVSRSSLECIEGADNNKNKISKMIMQQAQEF